MESYFRYWIAEKSNAHPPKTHYHPDFEVYYLTDGCCRYFIGSKTYRLNAGDLVVIPPGVIHKVIYESKTHSRLLFNCTTDYIPNSVMNMIDKITYFSQTTDTSRQVAAIYKRISDAVTQPDCFQEDTIRCNTMQLFLLMAKATAGKESISVSSPFIEKAVSHIHTNYMYRLTLSDTAKLCAVSPEHLSRVFKKETGFGFNEYLNLYRLKKAESILKSGQIKSISEIAFLCGFGDSNHFSKSYKNMFGVAPSQVYKQAKQESAYD